MVSHQTWRSTYFKPSCTSHMCQHGTHGSEEHCDEVGGGGITKIVSNRVETPQGEKEHDSVPARDVHLLHWTTELDSPRGWPDALSD